MAEPQYGTDTRADLANTGSIYDQAMASSPDKVYQQNMRGTGAAQGLLSDNGSYDKGLSDQPMSQAIQQKYMRQYSTQNQALQNQEKNAADEQYFNKLSHANQMVQEEQAMNYQKRMQKYQQDLARKRARGAVVGQVLGVVGAVVGGVAGAFAGGVGAAPGAAAGYAGGQALGNAIGGS